MEWRMFGSDVEDVNAFARALSYSSWRIHSQYSTLNDSKNINLLTNEYGCFTYCNLVMMYHVWSV